MTLSLYQIIGELFVGMTQAQQEAKAQSEARAALLAELEAMKAQCADKCGSDLASFNGIDNPS